MSADFSASRAMISGHSQSVPSSPVGPCCPLEPIGTTIVRLRGRNDSISAQVDMAVAWESSSGGYRLAGSLLVMTIRAARTGREASDQHAKVHELPVAVLAQPMMAGPQKPPDSPMVLISAMPPAAAGPLI